MDNSGASIFSMSPLLGDAQLRRPSLRLGSSSPTVKAKLVFRNCIQKVFSVSNSGHYSGRHVGVNTSRWDIHLFADLGVRAVGVLGRFFSILFILLYMMNANCTTAFSNMHRLISHHTP